MSHKGSPYELAFRRDLYQAPSIHSYRTALAEKYLLTWTGLSGSLAGGLPSTPQLATSVDPLAPALIAWQTEGIHSAGSVLKFRLDVGINTNTWQNTIVARIHGESEGELIRSSRSFFDPNWAAALGSDRWTLEFTLDSSLLAASGLLVGPGVSAKQYD